MKLSKKVTGALVLGLMMGGGTLLAAAPASAACGVSGWFCAYDFENYTGVLVETQTTANTTVDVGNDKVSAAKNYTTKKYCAVDGTSIIMYIPSGTAVTAWGGATNRTDYFWVGTAGGCS